MDLHKLEDFMNETIDAAALRTLIADETQEFAEKMEAGDGCIPLYGSRDDFRFVVQPGHLKLICHAYFSGAIEPWDTYYLSDLIMLSHSFLPVDASVEEALFAMSNPVSNRPISRQAARRIFFWLDDPDGASLSEVIEPYGARV